jgi:ubiquinone/menaquinone biosynthesis C-methylase UbiE
LADRVGSSLGGARLEPAAGLACSFGRVAVAYDDARPEYAPQALEHVADALALGEQARVVDLGAGTGKLTRRLEERFAEVVAVEPDDDMRVVLEARTPGAISVAGTAELIPLPDSYADAVFVADAFHWFDAGAALQEVARVLRGDGGLVLLWNVWWTDRRDRTSDQFDPPLPKAARELLDAVYVASGRAAWASTAGDPLEALADSPFGPVDEAEFPRELELAPAEVVDLYGTVSSVASLPERERAELASAVRELLSGTYRLRVTTRLFWTRLR